MGRYVRVYLNQPGKAIIPLLSGSGRSSPSFQQGLFMMFDKLLDTQVDFYSKGDKNTFNQE